MFNSKCFLILFTIFMETEKAYGNKYCAFELDGEAKYYMCPRNEYCCNFGCCVNLAFQFYQLWYYWLLILVMFMICSGGGWWYRFCRQNDTTSYPNVPPIINSHFMNQTSTPVTTRDLHQRNANELSSRRVRLTRSTHRLNRINNNNNINLSNNNLNTNNNDQNTQFYIQPIWKGPSSHQNLQLPPSYYSSNQYSIQEQQFYQDCPYHQLYGPPPSYDSVVQISDTTGNGQTSCSLVVQQQTTQTDLSSTTTTPTQIDDTQNEDESLLNSRTESTVDHTDSDVKINNIINSSKSNSQENILEKKTQLSTTSSPIQEQSSSCQTDENLLSAFNVIPSTSKIKVDDHTNISSV